MAPSEHPPAMPLQSERTVTRAFEDAGAVSPAAARPLAEIPGADLATVVALTARRLVREGGPGRYYLHTGAVHARRRALVTAVVVLVLLLLPVLLVQFTSRAAP